MPYWKLVWRGGTVVEIMKYHSARYPCIGERRGKRQTESTSTQIKVNIRLATRNLRWLMNANFCDNDYLVTLDYKKDMRPASSQAMQGDMSRCLRKLRKAYKKEGVPLKYIYVKERGPRGAAHIHMMLSECGTRNIARLLKECWDKGGIHIDPLNTDGQYAKVAEYFEKYANKTIETDGELIGKRYYPSRNLIRPEPVKKIIRGVNTYYENIRVPEGYYLEKDSVISGKTMEGYDYFSYTLHKLEQINTVRKRE